ncbi:hypothetical protein V9T40_014093 [Parthenolecanium corni]|uniref:Uncharacterized protein n=1 Tax=Parthenolecanium corni TaxID=536013 RepID=A0AAN9TEJ3_9HEMI
MSRLVLVVDLHSRVEKLLVVFHCSPEVNFTTSSISSHVPTHAPFSNIFEVPPHITIRCLIFRLDVSFFGWMSQFSSGCLNFRLDVPFFV